MRVNVSVILTDEDKVLIMKRPDDDRHYPGCWGIPGGGMEDDDEGVEHTAQREMKEELGLDIHADSLLYSNKYKDILFLVVDAWLEEGASREPTLSKEATDFKWASLVELKGLEFTPFTKQRIIDYMSKGNE